MGYTAHLFENRLPGGHGDFRVRLRSFQGFFSAVAGGTRHALGMWPIHVDYGDTRKRELASPLRVSCIIRRIYRGMLVDRCVSGRNPCSPLPRQGGRGDTRTLARMHRIPLSLLVAMKKNPWSTGNYSGSRATTNVSSRSLANPGIYI